MRKSYNTFWALVDDDTILYGKTVVCDNIRFCNEARFCGGADPHMYDPKECGHCPFDKDARCYPIQE